MTDHAAIDLVQRMRRELIEHHAKIQQRGAEHRGHRCYAGAYLAGYADAIETMTVALTGALTDVLRDDRP